MNEQNICRERRSAQHFMYWVTGEELDPIDEPDRTQPSRRGGRPDFIFMDSYNVRYVLELTTLLTPQLRRLQETLKARICDRVGPFPGTYILHAQLASSIGTDWIDPAILRQVEVEISDLVNSGSFPDRQELKHGFSLLKVKPDGTELIPWITCPLLPPEPSSDSHDYYELHQAFVSLVREADAKLEGYEPVRVLIIATAQSGLDLEYHAGVWRGGKGILFSWMDEMGNQLRNIDAIHLEPGACLWWGGRKVMAGHNLVDRKAGSYNELWRRGGVPRLLKQ